MLNRLLVARHPKVTKKVQAPPHSHQSIGAIEQSHRTIQGHVRTMKLAFEEHYGFRLVPGMVALPWLVRHSAWTLTRFMPRGKFGQTAYEARHGKGMM